MALGGVAVTWDSTKPSVTSQAGIGYQDLQSIKSTMQQVTDSEHVFESTGGSNTGIHRKGSAVVFYGASSAISSSDTNGRLMIDSTNSRLHQAGSSNTMVLGGQYTTFGTGLKGTISAVTQMFGFEASFCTILNGSTGTTCTLTNTWVSAAVFAQPVVRNSGNVNIGGLPFAVTTNGTGLITGTNSVTIVHNVFASGATTGMSGSATTEYGVMVYVFGIKAL